MKIAVVYDCPINQVTEGDAVSYVVFPPPPHQSSGEQAETMADAVAIAKRLRAEHPKVKNKPIATA